jgi:predicted PurR-regulated permease PerM
MTDSAVLDTVLGLVFLFYALALLCGGLVEMIANWVKKRAKYLLRGIQDLLDDISPEHGDLVVAESTGWDRMQNTAQTVLLNGRVESQRYDAMLQAEAGLLPAAPSVPPS